MEQNVQNPQPRSGKKIGCWIAGCFAALVVLVLFISGIVGVAFWATKGPVKVINEQLVYLRRGDIESAYLVTSGDFRKATSLEQFKQFIARNPSLAQNKGASFTSRKIENDRGYVEGSLTAVDGSRTPIKYTLIKENEVWKVLAIEVSPAGIESPQAKKQEPSLPITTTIEKIEVGTQRAEDGSIVDSGTKFIQSVGEILVSAYIADAKKGQWVSAVWYFAGEAISDPVVNQMAEDGDRIAFFSVNPPENGWPTGNYKVVVAIDKDKAIKEMSYTIGM